jgi:hypothetical protein
VRGSKGHQTGNKQPKAGGFRYGVIGRGIGLVDHITDKYETIQQASVSSASIARTTEQIISAPKIQDAVWGQNEVNKSRFGFIDQASLSIYIIAISKECIGSQIRKEQIGAGIIGLVKLKQSGLPARESPEVSGCAGCILLVVKTHAQREFECIEGRGIGDVERVIAIEFLAPRSLSDLFSNYLILMSLMFFDLKITLLKS